MTAHRRGGSGRPWLSAVLAVAVFAVLATPASAATTQSNVTSVTDPGGSLSFGSFSTGLSDAYNNLANKVTISGTSNDTAGDPLAVYCVYLNSGGYRNWASIGSVAGGDGVNSDGSFSKSFSKDSFPHRNSCRLVALPSGTNVSSYDTSAFTGPGVGLGWSSGASDNTDNRGPGGTTRTYDYFSSFPQAGGLFQYDSIGSCGIAWSMPFSGASFRQMSDGMWRCAAAAYSGEYTGSRSQMQVDGVNAYNGSSAPRQYCVANGTGATTGYWACVFDPSNYHWVDVLGGPNVSYSYSQDPSSGNVVIHEGQDLVRCVPASGHSAGYPADSYNCASLEPTGVHLDRTITQDHDGRLATLSDSYSSTDGQSHNLDVEYDNRVGLSSSAYNQWKVPGQDWTSYGQGDQPALPASSTGTIYVRDTRYPDDSTREPAGSISYRTLPNRAVFQYPGDLMLNYQRSVPATGALTITQAYGQGLSQSDAQAIGSSAEDAWSGPSVAITGPADGATVDASPVTVTGTASDNVAVKSLKVNGQTVPVGSDGTWSAQVPLNPGPNAISAVALDGAGNQAQSQETLIYTTRAPDCTVPNLTMLPLPQAQRVLTAAHCATGKVTTRRAKTVPAGRVVVQQVDPGKVLPNSSKVALVVSKKAAAKRHHKKHSTRRHART
jgi:hypothetical protein